MVIRQSFFHLKLIKIQDRVKLIVGVWRQERQTSDDFLTILRLKPTIFLSDLCHEQSLKTEITCFSALDFADHFYYLIVFIYKIKLFYSIFQVINKVIYTFFFRKVFKIYFTTTNSLIIPLNTNSVYIRLNWIRILVINNYWVQTIHKTNYWANTFELKLNLNN